MLGNLNDHLDLQVARTLPLHSRRAFAANRELRVALRSSGNLHAHLRAVRRRDDDACSERRLRHGDRYVDKHVGAIAREVGMGLDLGGDEQIARLAAACAQAALAAEAKPAAVNGARGNLHRESFRGILAGDANGHALLGAVKRLVERHVQGNVHVLALLRARTATSAAAEVAEIPFRAESALAAADAFQDIGPAAGTAHAAEDVLDIHTLAAAPAARNLVLVRRAVLVVELALLVVGEHLVGFVELLELGLVAARVGVVLARELAKRLLYLIGGRRARNAQRFVVIRSCRHTRPPAFLI